MKLYIYEHCPFCARVAYVANALKLNVEYQVVDYADAQTLIDLIGQKMVPVLEKADGRKHGYHYLLHRSSWY
nr:MULTISPECIES: glutathione S-transferase N-terminal domain-containing protein [Vibrio]